MQPFTQRMSIAIMVTGLAVVAACQRDDTDRAAGSAVTPGSVPSAPAKAAPTVPAPPPAAADEQPPEGVLRAYVWACDDGATLTMKNLFRDNAITLDLHEGPRRLDHVPSASGAKYADESLSFWTRGGAALFERKGSPAVNCRELRAQSILADARVRGVDYRGTGNEPGWFVEAGPGNRLLFVTNFGQERHEHDDAAIRGGAEIKVVVYDVDKGEDSVKVTFRQEPCTDDMSGEEFDHAVVVEFRKQTLRGCGTALRH